MILDHFTLASAMAAGPASTKLRRDSRLASIFFTLLLAYGYAEEETRAMEFAGVPGNYKQPSVRSRRRTEKCGPCSCCWRPTQWGSAPRLWFVRRHDVLGLAKNGYFGCSASVSAVRNDGSRETETDTRMDRSRDEALLDERSSALFLLG